MNLGKCSNVFTSLLNKFTFTRDMFGKNEWDRHLQEWISALLTENERLKAEAHPQTGMAISEAASLLFTTSKKLGISSITKFLALDIYQKFCILHIEYLTKHVMEEEENRTEDQKRLLKEVQVKVGQQAPLRVLTCLWIASKLTTHKRGITKESVKEILMEIGSNISINAICKSEIRILKQINFNCYGSSTLPEYIGVLVAYVGTNPHSGNTLPLTTDGQKLDSIFQTALQVLEFVYFNYENVYDEIFYKVTGLRVVSKHHVEAFARVRCDRLLLASSVIAAACWLQERDELFDSVVKRLCSVNEIPAEDVITFSESIVNLLFSF